MFPTIIFYFIWALVGNLFSFKFVKIEEMSRENDNTLQEQVVMEGDGQCSGVEEDNEGSSSVPPSAKDDEAPCDMNITFNIRPQPP